MGKVYFVAEIRHEENLPWHELIKLTEIDRRDVKRKVELLKRILQAEKEIADELPPEPEPGLPERLNWTVQYMKLYEERVHPISKEYQNIRGPHDIYLVARGKYKLGQILESVPEAAVLFTTRRN